MLWKEKYRIGVPLIDSQHEELFRRVGSFVETLRSEGEWEDKRGKVNETLSFMQDYVVVHFRDEEEYQKSVGYPDFEEHSNLHRQMVQEVLDFAKMYEEQGFQKTHVLQFAGKLLAWLINHVAATDQKIADFVTERDGELL